MGISRRSITRQRQPREQGEAVLKAREIRRKVAAQVAAGVLVSDMTGSKEHVALCVRRVVEAERESVETRDANVLRGALSDLVVGAAAYVAAIDLRSPARKPYAPPPDPDDWSRADEIADAVLRALREVDPEAPPPEWVRSNGSSTRRRRNGREHI